MEEEVPAGASVKVSTPRAEGPPSLKWMLMKMALLCLLAMRTRSWRVMKLSVSRVITTW